MSIPRKSPELNELLRKLRRFQQICPATRAAGGDGGVKRPGPHVEPIRTM